MLWYIFQCANAFLLVLRMQYNLTWEEMTKAPIYSLCRHDYIETLLTTFTFTVLLFYDQSKF